MGARLARRSSSAPSGAKLHVAERMLALAEAPRSSARSMVRASAQATSNPWARRKRAPRSLARSSPLDMTRARVRSLTSPMSAMPAAICRSSPSWRSQSGPSGRPSSVASRWCRSWMSLSSSSCASPRAAASNFSRRSVMPVTAECTMSTRAPSARRAAATLAMLRQLASEETLLTPNLRTIQSDAVRATRACRRQAAPGGGSPDEASWRPVAGAVPRGGLQLFVEVFERFLEFLVREDLFQPAPRGLAALHLVADALVHPVEQPVVIGAVLGGPAQEFLVEIEALVVSFRHLAMKILS